MGLNSDIRDIKEEFDDLYCRSPPYNEFVSNSIISNVERERDNRSQIRFREGESSDDPCLRVYLKELPDDCEMPTTFGGVRIFYELEEEYIEDVINTFLGNE